jgi:uridylate kinase
MYIIKYGGSRVSPTPDSYDNEFIDSLIELVKKYPNEKFLIIIGGGALCRKMQEGVEDKEKKDLVGIEATRINAKYVISRFEEAKLNVYPKVLTDPTKKVEGDYQVYFSGGWKPGNSTDFVTMKYAETFNADKVIKVSNFDYVKDVSPLKLKDKNKEKMKDILKKAEDLKEITWQKMVDLVGTEWVPGLHTPLDSKAAGLGLKNRNITLYIIPESEVEKVLSEQEFVGTIVNG